MLSRTTPAALALLLLGLGGLSLARAEDADPRRADLAEGKRVFQTANCMGCHKWHGDGGGGYGGDALSLRRTQLDRDQIIQTVECGRPGTGMPYHLRGAYDGDGSVCNGMTRAMLGKEMPPEAAHFLRPSEIGAVADYVSAEIKGKGPPSYADCEAFFGAGARVCNVYKNQQPSSSSSSSGGGHESGHEGG